MSRHCYFNTLRTSWISNILYNKKTSSVQQKISYWRCSFEIFFILSIHLQRLKYSKNTWDWVKLLRFNNKFTSSIKKFIKGFYLLQILFTWFFKWISEELFLKTSHSHSIRQHKLWIYYYSIIFNWTSWLLQ